MSTELDKMVVSGEASLTDGHGKLPEVLVIAATATWPRRMTSGIDPRLKRGAVLDGEWHDAGVVRACLPRKVKYVGNKRARLTGVGTR